MVASVSRLILLRWHHAENSSFVNIGFAHISSICFLRGQLALLGTQGSENIPLLHVIYPGHTIPDRKVATSLSLQNYYAWFWRRSAITCGCSLAIKCPQPAATCAITLRQPNFLVSSLAVGPGLPEP